MKHRTKWLLVTAAALLAGSAAIGAAGLLLLRGALYQTAEERGGVILENIGARMEQEMTALSGAADFLCGSETTQYFTAFAALLPAADEAALRAAFEEYLHGTALNTALVETVVFIGENENQASYVYDTRTGTARGTAVPTFEKWYRAGLTELLFGSGSVFYIDNDVSEAALNPDYLATYPDQRPMLRDWLDLLRGHYGFLQLREHFTVLFLLRDDFFAQAAAPFAGERDAVSLELPDGSRVAHVGWTGQSGSGDVRWRGTRPFAGTKLTIACERRSDPTAYRGFLLAFGAAAVLLGAAALLLVRARSRHILAPFDHLTARIHASIDSDDFQVIAPDDPGFGKARPLHTAIFRLFLTGLMVPTLLLGAVSAFLVNHELTQRLWGLSELRATALQESLKTNLRISEDILRLISQKPDFAAVAGSRVAGLDTATAWQRTLRLNAYVNRFPLGMYNVSYLVLLDAAGQAKYQSLYRDEEGARNQLNGFSLSEQAEAAEQLRALEGDIGLLVCENIYQQSTASVVKKLYDDGGHLVGYLQMVYNPNYFQGIGARQSAEYLLLRQPEGQLVFNSGGAPFYAPATALLTSERPSAAVMVGGHRYLAEHAGRVEGSDWALVVFQRADDLLHLAYAVLWQNLLMLGGLLMLLFLISLGLSRLMSRPLLAIEADLSQVIASGCRGFVAYGRSDELSRLVDTYNLVIGQLNELMAGMVEKKTVEQRLQNLQTQAELESLRQQIASHFFRNTLENIHMQVHCGERESACQMLVALSRLFSYGMTRRDRIELGKEIEYVENYILIQRVRLHDAFAVTWVVDPDALLVVVPKLILQPLVENSITHGLYEYQTGGHIAIRIDREGDQLVIEVADNGVGIATDELEALRRSLQPTAEEAGSTADSGLALRNISLRLRMYGGGRTSLTIDSAPMQGTTVTIRLDIGAAGEANGPPPGQALSGESPDQ